MKPVIVRMPPSPTGLLHLGTARTVLFNYLFAKNQKGQIVFRWEDTDKERSKTEFETNIIEGLQWLGMDFEAENTRFYRQSESADRHAEVLAKLWEQNIVFPCFSSSEEIDAMRAKAREEKRNFVFWSPFRDVERSTLEERMKSDPFVWRLRVEPDKEIIFEDIVRKSITVHTRTLGDFAVARSDGSVLYLLANVIDDIDQGITHIIRGEDGLPNTPKQRLLFEALGKEVPQYAHIPLVLDTKKRKLSKRNVEPGTCVLIDEFKTGGFLPEAVLNGLAFLGWNPKSTEELFSMDDLIERFTLEGVNPAGSQYDFEKMRWFNGKWINRLPVDSVIRTYESWAGESLGEISKKAFDVAKGKARVFSDIKTEMQYMVSDPGAPGDLILHEKFGVTTEVATAVIIKVLTYVKAQDSLTDSDQIKQDLILIIKEMELKNGTFLWPLRITLSNNEKSASPFEIMSVLGKEETIKRLERVL